MNKFKNHILLFSVLLSFQLHGQTYQSETNTVDAKATVVEKKNVAPELAVYPTKDKFPLSLVTLGSGKYFSKYALLLDKKSRTLTIWSTTENGTPKFIEAFPSDMGRVSGDKQVLGDLKTPEGIYFFQSIYNENQLNFNEYGKRAFTTNYPNLFDKRNKKTGSGIWLHAIPPTKTLFRGSRGCVVVRNNVIVKLNSYISLKDTPFVIEDSVDYVVEEALQKKKENLDLWLNSWMTAWKNKNLENYMAYYNDDFYSKKMTKKRWRNYKARLNKVYSFIDVNYSDPVIYKQGDKLIVKFIQSYKSDTISDSGEKTLHVVSKNDGWQIISEVWKPLKKKYLTNYQSDSGTESTIKNN